MPYRKRAAQTDTQNMVQKEYSRTHYIQYSISIYLSYKFHLIMLVFTSNRDTILDKAQEDRFKYVFKFCYVRFNEGH